MMKINKKVIVTIMCIEESLKNKLVSKSILTVQALYSFIISWKNIHTTREDLKTGYTIKTSHLYNHYLFLVN